MIIGEEDGCTSAGYLNELNNDSRWNLTLTVNIPKWSAIHARLVIYNKV